VRASAATQLKQLRNIAVTRNPDPYAAGLIETFERDPKQLQLPVSVEPPP
jgi:hypothetical protein